MEEQKNILILRYLEFKNKLPILFIIIFLSTALSCQKVIDVDLNSANPALVIEGIITDGPGPYIVKLTNSTDYFNPGTPQAVTNATVVISDSDGNSDILQNSGDGIYKTITLQGKSGKTYKIKVSVDGKNYEGQSYMPPLVRLDTIVLSKEASAGGFGGGSPRPGNSKGLIINCAFLDPVDAVNYYSFNLYIDSAIKKREGNARFTIQNDQNFNGQILTHSFRNRTKTGDTVKIELLSINKPTYDYYRTINSIAGGGGGIGGGNAAPANPNTNLTNGAMGYFAAIAVSRKKLIVK